MTIETLGDVAAHKCTWLILGTASAYLLACIVRYFIIIWADYGWRRRTLKAIVCPIAYEAIFAVCQALLLALLFSVALGVFALWQHS